MARVEDLDELRRQLGECLYVVQSFYSNTNWVEMFGGVSYPNFGKKNKIMLHSRSIRFLKLIRSKKKRIIKKKEQTTQTNPKKQK
jgi:muramoyltetrapeptide carboxypeptidase LdcA involved in peptidoglycan recycling